MKFLDSNRDAMVVCVTLLALVGCSGVTPQPRPFNVLGNTPGLSAARLPDAHSADRKVFYAIRDLGSMLPASLPNGASSLDARQPLASSFGRQTRSDVVFATLFNFHGSDGAKPAADLIDVNGKLYGTTTEGGASCGCGTVFAITTSGTENVVHSFIGGADGRTPLAGLTEVNGDLYGTTELGGGSDCGTVFKITPSGAETVLHGFKCGTDGEFPYAVLANVSGTLYGTTRAGGVSACIADGNGCGTVFSITTSGDKKILHNFTGPPYDGESLLAGLTNVNGTLYGTTFYGGRFSGCSGDGCGTVFKITTSGTEMVLYSFKGGTDGAHPAAALIDVNGTLYGTTRNGGNGGSQCGSYGCGTAFKITTSGMEKVLHAFNGSDGAGPSGRLKYQNGALYGTTYLGGAYYNGTIFKITKSGTETVLHSFRGNDGAGPAAGLTDVSGTLYGTTADGSNSTCNFGCGSVFKLSP